MHLKIKLVTLVALFMLLGPSTAFGQGAWEFDCFGNNFFSWQTQLSDSAGNPLAVGNYVLVYCYYEDSAATMLIGCCTDTITIAAAKSLSSSAAISTRIISTSFAYPVPINEDVVKRRSIAALAFPEIWLEITLEGETLEPTFRLYSVPFAGVAQRINGDIVTRPGRIIVSSPDVADSSRIVLSADETGGELDLRNSVGASTINLHGGQTGNSSVGFPTGAIYDNEILDEPGVANQVRSSTFFILDSVTFYAVDSVDITIPTSGYVELTGGCYLNLNHNNGTKTEYWVGISKSSASFNFSSTPGVQVARAPAVAATAIYQMPCTSTRIFAESAGTHRYYLLVRRNSGTNNNGNVAMIYLRAKFYPTAYGSIVLSKSDNGPNEPRTSLIPTDGSQQYENLNLRVQTLEEINAKLEAEKEALRVENERLRFEKE